MNDFETVVERHPPALPGAADHAAGPAATQGGLAAGPRRPRLNSIITCTNCERGDQPHGGHGWCKTCYRNWLYAGRPADGPPPFGNPAGRREDYYWLRDEQGLTIAQAADRVGVCYRTATRYEAKRRRAVAA